MKTTQPAPSFFADPTLQMLGASGGLLLILLIVQAIVGGKHRKGKTARGRFATSREIANSARAARKMLAKPGAKNFTYYITEPVGRWVPPPSKLGKYKVGKDISYFIKTNTSTLVTGGAGSGKTANFINPAVLSAVRQGASIIYYDYKFPDPDQSLPVIMEALREGYQVRILAPGQDLSQCFNIVDLIPDDTAMTKASEVIDVMALNFFDTAQKKDYFDRSGANIASGSLLLAKWIARVTDRPELANLLMASQILSLSKLALRLIQNRNKLNPWTYKAFDGLTSIQSGKEVNRQQVGVIGTAQEIFKKPTAIELIPALCGASTLPLFDPKDPLKIDGKVLLVLGVDKGLKESVLPAFATILHQLLTYNLDAKRPRKTTLVTVVDECSTIKVPWFLTGIAQERGTGFSAIFGAQYPGQLENAYGKDLSEGFEANCGNAIWFGTGNQATAEHVSKMLGKTDLILDSHSKSTSHGKSGGGGSRSTSEQIHKVDLLEPQEIKQFPPGKAIIFTPGVGDGKSVRIPYIHQFNYDEGAAKAHSNEAQKVFEQLSQALIAANPPKDSRYYSDLLDEYNLILEKWLPLGDDGADQSRSSSPQNPNHHQVFVKGQRLIDILQRHGKDSTGIEAQNNYNVPHELINSHRKMLLNLENCLKILGRPNV